MIRIRSYSGFFEKWKIRVRESLVKNPFVSFYCAQKRSRQEYKTLCSQQSVKAVEQLIKGIGGIKNVSSMKSTINSLKIFIKFRFLVDDEAIKNCGGVGIIIEDHLVSVMFDSILCKDIVIGFKKELAKKRWKPLDWE